MAKRAPKSDGEPVEKKLTPYDFVTAISHTKKNIFETDPTAEKVYTPFVTNRALSLTQDTLKPAQAMNLRSWLPKEVQFTFLLNMVRARKRYAKWLKKPALDEQVDLVAKYYKVSLRKARIMVALHTPEQLDLMKSRLDRGGASRNSS